MCGIVGAVAQRNIVPILIEGLRKLEYRGYDSAGIALLGDDGRMERVRAVGRVAELEHRAEEQHADAPTPIRATTTTIFQPHTDRAWGRNEDRNGSRAILPGPALLRESLHRPIPTNRLLPTCRGNPGPCPNPATLLGTPPATLTKPATTTGTVGARKTGREPNRTTKTPLQ